MNKEKIILSENAIKVANDRYYMDGEDWFLATLRVAKTIASVEGDKAKEFQEKFHEMIYEMLFIPAGRILRNAGRPKGSLLNCYVLSIEDSIEAIGRMNADCLTLWSEGGGVGCNWSPLRPKGTPILGKGGTSSGVVSFMKGNDAYAKTIESGGSRRAAALACMSIEHPEVLDFIDAKLERSELNSFNISVILNSDFLMAVEKDALWEFKFNQKTYFSKPAVEVFNKIVTNMLKSAEPGILYGDNLFTNNSYYCAPILSTNPCITGDMKVMVADGRGQVTIKELAEEGRDVPVLSINEGSGKLEVKMMRNPRITGYNEKIIKLTMDDGSFIRCTENHKILLKNGIFEEARNIKPGDRLRHLKRKFYFDKVGHSSILWNGEFEHRLITEHYLGRKLENGEIIHHIDKNAYNNRFENLKVMNFSEHSRHHQLGDNNVMRDKWWNKQSDERKDAYRKAMSKSTAGEKNGRYLGYSREFLASEIRKLILSKGREIQTKEWMDFCEEKGYPKESRFLYETNSGKPGKFIRKIFNSLKEESPELRSFSHPHKIKAYNNFMKIKNETDLDIYFNDDTGDINVRKVCKCGKEFIVGWGKREICYCSRSCGTKYGKHGSKVEVINDISPELNFKVISVEEDGFENVYNGTVDDNHNFLLSPENYSRDSIIFIEDFIISQNCGESPLSASDACDLGSIVLPNFVANTNTNWQKLNQVIELSIRFLDNVLDINKYSLDAIDRMTHSLRRVGLGVMGLADYLFAKKLRYGSQKSISEIERLMRFIRDSAYRASIKLAMEKGSFPKFDPIPYWKAKFVRSLPAELRQDIKTKGIRNVTLLALAPTGCLVPETRIKTNIGSLTLRDIFQLNNICINDQINKNEKWFHNIREDIKVYSLNGERKINKLFINGKSNTFKIFNNDDLLCEGTGEHKVLVQSKENVNTAHWKRFDQIKIGDNILKLREYFNNCGFSENINLDEPLIDLSGFNLVEVTKIERNENITVDMEVEPDHYYLLDNGIISHNTISLIPDVTPGIEPLFAKAYRRNDRVGERIYVHSKYKEMIEKGEETPEWFVDAYDLSPRDHFEIQCAAQKFVDGGVSKTINLPKDTGVDQLDKLLLEYIYDLKGVTVYRDGTRENQIYTKLYENEVRDILREDANKVVQNLDESEVLCPSGSCEVKYN